MNTCEQHHTPKILSIPYDISTVSYSFIPFISHTSQLTPYYPVQSNHLFLSNQKIAQHRPTPSHGMPNLYKIQPVKSLKPNKNTPAAREVAREYFVGRKSRTAGRRLSGRQGTIRSAGKKGDKKAPHERSRAREAEAAERSPSMLPLR